MNNDSIVNNFMSKNNLLSFYDWVLCVIPLFSFYKVNDIIRPEVLIKRVWALLLSKITE